MSTPVTSFEEVYRVQTARVEELLQKMQQLERENAELNDTLDVVVAADERAVAAWRAAHPRNELVTPDRAELVGWLLEQLAAQKEPQP